MTKWWIDRGASTQGPFDEAKVLRYFAEDRIKPDFKLSKDNQNWILASDASAILSRQSAKSAADEGALADDDEIVDSPSYTEVDEAKARRKRAREREKERGSRKAAPDRGQAHGNKGAIIIAAVIVALGLIVGAFVYRNSGAGKDTKTGAKNSVTDSNQNDRPDAERAHNVEPVKAPRNKLTRIDAEQLSDLNGQIKMDSLAFDLARSNELSSFELSQKIPPEYYQELRQAIAKYRQYKQEREEIADRLLDRVFTIARILRDGGSDNYKMARDTLDLVETTHLLIFCSDGAKPRYEREYFEIKRAVSR